MEEYTYKCEWFVCIHDNDSNLVSSFKVKDEASAKRCLELLRDSLVDDLSVLITDIPF